MHVDFKNIADQLEPTLAKLLSAAPIDVLALPYKSALSGVYILSENGKPIYVGRTRNLRQRIVGHYNVNDPNAGSFAFLMACETYGRKKAAYTKKGGRKSLHANQDFFENHMKGANKRLRSMTIQFVEIPDPKMQYIFEIYAAIAINAPYNKFETH